MFIRTDANGDKNIIISHVATALVGVFILVNSVGFVGTGHRGVLTNFGAVTGKVYGEGIFVKKPILQSVKKFDVRIQKVQVDADSASSDLQTISATVALNYRLDATKVAGLYQNIGVDYADRLIAPAIQESVKSSTAQFTAEELITKRADVREAIKVNLREKLSPHGISVEEFNIVNFDFSDSFNVAIEKKVTAEQDALASKNKLEQVKFEAQQRVEEAKGKAEAITVESNALRNNPDVLKLRALEKWDGTLPKVTGGAVPFIDIGK